jgi:hypothetical protein
MASRILALSARALTRTPAARAFTTSSAQRNAVAAGGVVPPLQARRPIGALRGGYVFLFAFFLPDLTKQEYWLTCCCPGVSLFGFFLGSSLAAGGIYYYAIQEYKASNELLTEDIYVRVCI